MSGRDDASPGGITRMCFGFPRTMSVQAVVPM